MLLAVCWVGAPCREGTGCRLTLTAVLSRPWGRGCSPRATRCGGIATYSSAGASWAWNAWILPVMALLLIVVQETARCGCVTGKGFASLIREKFGVRLSIPFAMERF